MRLRLFYRGEKEYRPKKNYKKVHDSDGETEDENEDKKWKEEKRNFDSIFMMIKHLSIPPTPFTCGNTKLPILILGLEVINIDTDWLTIKLLLLRYIDNNNWIYGSIVSIVAISVAWRSVLLVVGRSRFCWFCHCPRHL